MLLTEKGLFIYWMGGWKAPPNLPGGKEQGSVQGFEVIADLQRVAVIV